MPVALNPDTGEAVVLKGGKWVPVDRSTEIAVNPQTHEVMVYNGHEWESAGKAPSPGFLEGATNAMTDMFTFGLGDEVAAAGGATGRWLRGEEWGKSYDELLARERRHRRQFSEEHPVASMAAGVAGGLGAAGQGAAKGGTALADALWKMTPKALGTGVGGTMARSAIVGSEFGAAMGLGSSEGDVTDRFLNAGEGALTGAAIGAIVPPAVALIKAGGQKAAQVILDRVRVGGYNGPKNAAMRKVLEALREDRMTPDQAIKKLRALGSEAGIADAGGESMLRLAEGAASVKGPTASQASRFYKGRASTMPARIGQALDKATGTHKTQYGLGKELKAARQKAATDAYKKAFAAKPVIEGDDVLQLIEDSADIQAAIKQARRMPKYKNLPANSIELMDKAYKNIGGKATKAWRSGDTTKYHDLKTLRDDLRAVLAEQNPAYDDAVTKFSDDMGLEDALKAGSDIFKEEAEATADHLAHLGEDELKAFATGVRSAVQKVISRTPRGADAANRLINRPDVRQKLKAAFGSGKVGRQRYDEFRKMLRAETAMAANKNFVTGNSATARRLASQENVGVDPMPLADLAMGRPGAASAGMLRNLQHYLTRPPAGVRDELGVLFSNNLAKNEEILRALAAANAARSAQTGGAVSLLERGLSQPVRRGLTTIPAQYAGRRR